MRPRIKVTYFIDNDNMSDAEFEDQEEKVFYIDLQMIQDFVRKNDSRINKGDSFNEISFEVTKD